MGFVVFIESLVFDAKVTLAYRMSLVILVYFVHYDYIISILLNLVFVVKKLFKYLKEYMTPT